MSEESPLVYAVRDNTIPDGVLVPGKFAVVARNAMSNRAEYNGLYVEIWKVLGSATPDTQSGVSWKRLVAVRGVAYWSSEIHRTMADIIENVSFVCDTQDEAMQILDYQKRTVQILRELDQNDIGGIARILAGRVIGLNQLIMEMNYKDQNNNDHNFIPVRVYKERVANQVSELVKHA